MLSTVTEFGDLSGVGDGRVSGSIIFSKIGKNIADAKRLVLKTDR